MKTVKRFMPLLVIVALFFIAHLLGLTEYLSYQTVRENYQQVRQYADANPVLAPLVYIGLYIIIVALSIPGAVYMTLIGGFIFPQPFSTIYTVTAATIGAVVIFSVAKYAFGAVPFEKLNKYIVVMEKEFQENEASYMLFLRLVPVFPFWVVNIAPAFAGVSLFTYTWTTFVGISPATFVFTQAGAGLSSILQAGDTPTIGNIMNTNVIIALVGLGVLALIPVVLKKFKTPRTPND